MYDLKNDRTQKSPVRKKEPGIDVIIEHCPILFEGLLVGTRLAVHMAAIERFMPELF